MNNSYLFVLYILLKIGMYKNSNVNFGFKDQGRTYSYFYIFLFLCLEDYGSLFRFNMQIYMVKILRSLFQFHSANPILSLWSFLSVLQSNLAMY